MWEILQLTILAEVAARQTNVIRVSRERTLVCGDSGMLNNDEDEFLAKDLQACFANPPPDQQRQDLSLDQN